MKLIIAIISKDDRGDVTHELISAKYSVTKIPTTGGFLSAGNITLWWVQNGKRLTQPLK